MLYDGAQGLSAGAPAPPAGTSPGVGTSPDFGVLAYEQEPTTIDEILRDVLRPDMDVQWDGERYVVTETLAPSD